MEVNKIAKSVFLALAAVTISSVVVPANAVEVAPGVKINGWVQNRLYDGSGATPLFRTYLASLYASADLPDDSKAYMEVDYQPWAANSGVFLESAYYDTKTGTNRTRIGKGRRLVFGMLPIYANRKTSDYGLVSDAFTRDRIQGVQYYATNGHLDAGISVHEAYRLGTRNLGEIPGDDTRNNATTSAIGHVVPHLCLRDISAQNSNRLQVSGRLGGKWNNGLRAGISGSYAALDPLDIANLKGTGDNSLRPIDPLNGTFPTDPIGPGFTKKSMYQYGADVEYKSKSGFVAQGEYYGSGVSNLGYFAWDGLIGYEASNGWKFYTRYGTQNMNIVPTNNPLTWDTQEITISIVQPLRKNLWLQYEYNVNLEKTNTGADVPNNVGFVELFASF